MLITTFEMISIDMGGVVSATMIGYLEMSHPLRPLRPCPDAKRIVERTDTLSILCMKHS